MLSNPPPGRPIPTMIAMAMLAWLACAPANAQLGPVPGITLSNLGQANGLTQLDSSGHVPFGQLPVGTGANSVAAGNDSRFTVPAITGGTINGATLGATTPLPQVNLGGSFVFAGVDAVANKGLIVNGTISGAASSNQSSIWNFAITSDQASVPNGWINDFNLQCTMGGGNFSGIRDCLASGVAVVASAASTDTSSRDYVSNLATGYATANDGGTAGTDGRGAYTSQGSITGYNANVRLANAATFWNVLQAQENDVAVLAGTSVGSVYGLSIDQGGGHASQGTFDDSGIVFSNVIGAIGWRCGICFGNSYAAWPMNANATLIGAPAASAGRSNLTQAQLATNGLDFRAVTFSGYALATPGFTVDPAGNVSTANINSPSIASTGSVVTVATVGVYRGQYPANDFPLLTIAAPPVTGSTATAVVSNMGWTGGPSTLISGGAGCSVNDVLTPAGSTGIPFQIKVTAIGTGGAATAFTPTGNAAGNMTAPFASATVTMTGGTCTTAPTYLPNNYIQAIALTGAGNGYSVPPVVTSAFSPLNNTAQLATTINNSLNISGNLGKITLTSAGTTLGQPGTVGAPVVLSSALVDQSKMRLTALSGAAPYFATAWNGIAASTAYTGQGNTSWIDLVQTGAISAMTLPLPASPVDGQMVRVSTNSAITALTLSPAVAGWPNGAALPAGTGIVLGYDGATAAWQFLSSPQAVIPPPTITYAATITPNMATGALQTVTLAGAMAMACPVMLAGGSYQIQLTQDATGGRVITWPSCFRWPGATPGVLSTAASAVDVLAFTAVSATTANAGLSKGYQ